VTLDAAGTGTADGLLYRQMVERSPAIIFVGRPDGTVAYVNDAWESFSGWPAAAVVEHGWVEVIYPDDANRVTGAWMHALATHTAFRDEFRIRTPAGHTRWVAVAATPAFDADGTPSAWYGTVHDTDDQYRAAQRRAMLARLGSTFVESLDFARTAQTFVTDMCRDFADFAFIDSLRTDGRLERIAVDMGRLSAAPELAYNIAPPPDALQHPINVALRTGRPMVDTVCDEEWVGRMTWSDEDSVSLRSLAIDAIVHLPMVAAGQHVGVLTFGAARGSGRSFSAGDIEDAGDVARQAALALANARLFADLAASETRYRGIIDTAQEGVWILDPQARTRYVNQRLAEMLGYSADHMYARSLYEFLTSETLPAAERAFEVQRRGGTERFEGTLVRADGGLIWAIIATSPILDPQGRFSGVLGMLTDITDRKAIETQYRLLTEATPQIVWTADPRGEATFINERWTALTGMPRTAALGYGWCDAVHPDDLSKMRSGLRSSRDGADDFEAECRLRTADGERYRWHLVRALARRDERGVLTEWLGSMTDIDTTRRLSWVRDIVARAGDVLNRSLDLDTLLERFAELLVAEVGDEATIRLTGGRAIVNRRCELNADAPALRDVLIHRDTQLGSVILRRRRPFEDDERALLQELAARAGAAIANTLLYEREHRVAVTLQRALLPAVLPRVDGLDFDAVYYPGATDAEIGGDWYDAIALPEGRVVVSIGDVTGRGLTAAVIMGRMRQTIETLATYETDPTRLLDAADAVLRRTHPDAIVTALVGVIDPSTRTLVYATAGHPTPFVREADGTVRRLPGRGLPLGLREGRQPPATTLVLPPWALAVFYTDGLIESTRDIDEGEQRVIEALRDPSIADARSPAAAIVTRVIDGAVRDDVALMAVRIGDAPSSSRPWTLRWRFDARDARRTYDIREVFVEALGAFGVGVDVAAAQLVFGELIGNAVRYTPGIVDVELDWLDPSTPVLHVVDDGPGFMVPDTLPSHDLETGRGLYLVSQLTREFRVWKDGDRGAHACAVLAGAGPRAHPEA
jgi:PAS domain S-box-containing protein